MTMATYSYTMPWGETLRISADLAQASAPILVEGAEEDDWQSTPYQTADARHRERDMVRLVIGHLGREWYGEADPDELADAIL